MGRCRSVPKPRAESESTQRVFRPKRAVQKDFIHLTNYILPKRKRVILLLKIVVYLSHSDVARGCCARVTSVKAPRARVFL